MVKDSEPRKSIGGLKKQRIPAHCRSVLCKVTFSNHTLPGGEGESEEEEEDESVAELKKPNSDEVGASKRTDGLFDWLVLGRFMD